MTGVFGCLLQDTRAGSLLAVLQVRLHMGALPQPAIHSKYSMLLSGAQVGSQVPRSCNVGGLTTAELTVNSQPLLPLSLSNAALTPLATVLVTPLILLSLAIAASSGCDSTSVMATMSSPRAVMMLSALLGPMPGRLSR